MGTQSIDQLWERKRQNGLNSRKSKPQKQGSGPVEAVAQTEMEDHDLHMANRCLLRMIFVLYLLELCLDSINMDLQIKKIKNIGSLYAFIYQRMWSVS